MITFPYTLAAGSTLNCSYSASLPDGADRTNTATATLQNSPSGTTDFTGSAVVAFAEATVEEVDECIAVTDNQLGNLGTVCVTDLPKTFTYSLDVGPYETCGTYAYDNTASFVTNDTDATGDDSWTVNVNIPCLGGCTLTQGYWKTHSEKGPAPYDDAWSQLANGADTPFFLSGHSYFEVLWTAPAGNVYYNLAHQYIAAELNALNDADFTTVQSTFDAATSLLNTYTPQEIAALRPNNSVRKLFVSLAATLDKYNNGLIGPGHCSEAINSATVGNAADTIFFIPLVVAK
ncbi:MAG: hypothetical protein R2932_50765 [Caldilineaceae bacterium]